jgi:hypothetical protein
MGFIAGTHGVPHLLAAGTHGGVVSQHTPGRTSGRNDRTGTPLVRASALHDVSAIESLAAEATWAQPLIREELS